MKYSIHKTKMLREKAQGCWPEILRSAGFAIPDKGKRSSCPFCGRNHSGNGSQAFRWLDKEGKFKAFCGSHSMDGFDCLVHAGNSFIEAKDIVAHYFGLDRNLTQEEIKTIERRAAKARERSKAEAAKQAQMKLDDALRNSCQQMLDAIETTGVSKDRNSIHTEGTRNMAAMLLLEMLIKAYPESITNLGKVKLSGKETLNYFCNLEKRLSEVNHG